MCKNQSELKKLADRAQSGDLGQFDDWIAAEKRWGEKGITEGDILHMTDERWPFDASIAENGASLTSFSFLSSDASHTSFTRLMTIWKETSLGNKARAVISEWLFDWLREPRNRKAPTTKVTTQELKQLCSDAQPFSFNNSMLQNIFLPDPLDETSIEFFEWLGNHIDNFYRSREHPLRLDAQIAQAYVNNPTRKGLLLFLGSLARYGDNISIPAKLLQENNLKSEKEWLPALLIRLTQGNWDETEARNLAKEFAKPGTKPNRIWFALRALNVPSLKAQAIESFVFALRDQLNPSQYNDYSQVVNFLEELMRQRRSNISDDAKWKECGLPALV
jgi:hypothetical protein